MLPILKGKKSKSDSNSEKDILFLDITTKSVKALYARLGEKKLIVKGVSTYDTKPSADDNILELAINECYQQVETETSNAIVGIGGSSVFGFLLILKFKRKNPESSINTKEIDEYYQKITDIAYNQAKQVRNTLFADESELETLDLVVNGFTVDGESVADPIDKSGEYLQVSVFSSYAEINYYQSLMAELKNLKINPLAVTTSLYSQVKAISSESKNFLLIDIGKTYTDVAVVFGKNIIQTRSFELGGDFFTSFLTDKLGLPPKDANGRKEAFSAGTLPPEQADSVSDLIYEAGKEWRTGLIGVLESMSGIKSFPKQIYMTGGSSALDVLEELLYEEEWKNTLPFSGELEVLRPGIALLEEFLVDDLRLLDNPRMFIPSSLSIIYNELEKDND